MGNHQKIKFFTLNECLETHDHGIQQWVWGLLIPQTYKIGFDLIPIRNQANLENFVISQKKITKKN